MQTRWRARDFETDRRRTPGPPVGARRPWERGPGGDARPPGHEPRGGRSAHRAGKPRVDGGRAPAGATGGGPGGPEAPDPPGPRARRAPAGVRDVQAPPEALGG